MTIDGRATVIQVNDRHPIRWRTGPITYFEVDKRGKQVGAHLFNQPFESLPPRVTAIITNGHRYEILEKETY